MALDIEDDQPGTYRVRLIVQNADDGLRQGMPVTIRIPDEVQNARSSL